MNQFGIVKMAMYTFGHLINIDLINYMYVL